MVKLARSPYRTAKRSPEWLKFKLNKQDEFVVCGWTAPGGTPDGFETEVSIEQSLHDRHGLDLGDEIRFDLSGRVIRARVTSIRKVTWDNTQNGGNHVHSVFRDFKDDFGRDLLREHYAKSHIP